MKKKVIIPLIFCSFLIVLGVVNLMQDNPRPMVAQDNPRPMTSQIDNV